MHVGQVDAIIGKAGRACREQRAEVGQLLAVQALGDGARLVHVDIAAGRARLVLYVLQGLDIVAGGQGVGHAHDRGEAAGRSRAHARGDVLLLGLARVTEVDMGVDEAGRDHKAAGVKGRTACRRVDVGFYPRQDAIVADEQVQAGVQAGIWV